MRRHLLEQAQYLPQPPREAFAFFADARNLEAITPPWLGFEVLTPEPIPMAAGTLIDYRLRLHGLRLRWRTRIEVWDPPHRFVDRQVRGPYRLWHHTHSFEPAGEGTIMRDVVRYTLPLGLAGAASHLLVVRRDVERIFAFRRRAIAARLAAPPILHNLK